METGKVGGNLADWHQLLAADMTTVPPVGSISRMDELCLMPLYELLEELLTLLNMGSIRKQDAYLSVFFDAVTEYLQSNPSDLDGFIRYWDGTFCSKAIPSRETDGMRIFSVHKSEGSEFHTVFIPFRDWKLENEVCNQLVWCTAPESPCNLIDLAPVNYSFAVAESAYRQDYLDERP